jgi:hypothetical protein
MGSELSVCFRLSDMGVLLDNRYGAKRTQQYHRLICIILDTHYVRTYCILEEKFPTEITALRAAGNFGYRGAVCDSEGCRSWPTSR